MKRWIHSSEDYFYHHRPSSHIDYPDEVASMDRILDGNFFPDDILDFPDRYFSDFRSYSDSRKMISILKKVQGDPNAIVTVYRGDPSSGVLNTGDWVTPSLEYAIQYTEDNAYSGDINSRIHSYKVKAGDLSFDGDSIFEFGYWGPKIGGTE